MKSKRLTKRNEDNYDLYVKLPTIEKQDFLNKLGQLEDIEEELGIDLTTLFKACMNGFYVKDYGDFSYCKLNLNECDLVIDFKYKRFTDNYANDYLFNDYGKTWALTKEELRR